MMAKRMIMLIITMIDPVGTFKLKLMMKPNNTEISEKIMAKIMEFLNESPIKILDATGRIINAEIRRTPMISIKIEMKRAKTIVIINCSNLTFTPDNFAYVSSKHRVIILLWKTRINVKIIIVNKMIKITSCLSTAYILPNNKEFVLLLPLSLKEMKIPDKATPKLITIGIDNSL